MNLRLKDVNIKTYCIPNNYRANKANDSNLIRQRILIRHYLIDEFANKNTKLKIIVYENYKANLSFLAYLIRQF